MLSEIPVISRLKKTDWPQQSLLACYYIGIDCGYITRMPDLHCKKKIQLSIESKIMLTHDD